VLLAAEFGMVAAPAECLTDAQHCSDGEHPICQSKLLLHPLNLLHACLCPQLAKHINGNHLTRLDGLQTVLGKGATSRDFVLKMGCT
jgi:hypothetical protein